MRVVQLWRRREVLRQKGCAVGRRRIRRLMRVLGIEALYPGPKTNVPHPEHRVYPYLLRLVSAVLMEISDDLEIVKRYVTFHE